MGRMLQFCTLAVVICCAYAHAGSDRHLSRDALVGKWIATVTPNDTSKYNIKEFTDTVTFKGMKFASDELQKQGFDPAPYDENPSPIGVAAKFSVTLTNKAGDTAKWTGESLGVEMTGELAITRKDGDTVSYTFKASKPQ